MKSFKFFKGIGCFGLAVVFTMALASMANAQLKSLAEEKGGATLFAGRCSEVTLKGGYGYRISGIDFPQGGSPYDFAGIGRMEFDGVGGLTATDTSSFGGFVVRSTIEGTYEVNPNCTGIMTIHFIGTPITLNADFTVFDEGKEFYMVVSDNGQVTTGHFKRQ